MGYRAVREANITYAPEMSDILPWNIGLYDTEIGDSELDGYTESIGAADEAEAKLIAEAWVSGKDAFNLPDGTLITLVVRGA